MSRIKSDIGKLPYLGFWTSNASTLSNIGHFFLYLLNKHPPIRLQEKSFQFCGEFGRNSPKKSENTNLYSNFPRLIFGLFLLNSSLKMNSFFMQSYRGMFV